MMKMSPVALSASMAASKLMEFVALREAAHRVSSLPSRTRHQPHSPRFSQGRDCHPAEL